MSFSLRDVAPDLESRLLINSKSAHEGKDRRRIEKGQQRHASLSPFKPASSLSPLTLLHRPLASECPCVNTKLLAILHHSTVQVCLQSAALQSFITNTAQAGFFTEITIQLMPHSAFHIIQGKETEMETLFTLALRVFKRCLQQIS